MFDHLIGNFPVRARLARMVAERRVPNSLILAGPEGIGKRHFAGELAQALVCPKASATGGCGQCPACVRSLQFVIPEPTDKNRDEFKRVFFSAHPDVASVVRYKNFIFVEAIRDLEREANFRPYEAGSRVFIVDDADSMNDAASNALLKTLEEPPSTSHLILVTSRADSLLPTIRSRCQMVRFAPVEPEVIADLLAEKRGFSHTDSVLAARLSGGSVARALSTDLAAFRESRERMFDVLRRAALDHDLASMIEASDRMNETKNKDDLDIHLRILETLVRDAWLLSLGADGDRIINSDLRPELEPVARAARPAVFASWLAAVEKMREGFEVNINRRVATDALLVAAASA